MNDFATDLDSAVDALLSDDATSDDNLDELLAAEGDDPDADGDDKYQDDVEASDDDIDDTDADDDAGADDDADDTDDDDDESEPEDALFPVKIDGKDEMWTLEKLKQSAAGQGYIQKQMQEQAAQRKELEKSTLQLAQERQAVFEAFQRLQSGASLTPPTPPSRELFESDPIGYMQDRLKYDEAVEEYQKTVQSYELVNQQQQAAQERQAAQDVDAQIQILSEHIPEFADATTRADMISKITNAGVEYYEFTAEELGGITDNRMIRALNDARKYREIEAKRVKADSKAKGARPVVKAGAKKTPESTKAVQRQKAHARLAKTGRIDDAVPLLFNDGQGVSK